MRLMTEKCTTEHYSLPLMQKHEHTLIHQIKNIRNLNEVGFKHDIKHERKTHLILVRSFITGKKKLFEILKIATLSEWYESSMTFMTVAMWPQTNKQTNKKYSHLCCSLSKMTWKLCKNNCWNTKNLLCIQYTNHSWCRKKYKQWRGDTLKDPRVQNRHPHPHRPDTLTVYELVLL